MPILDGGGEVAHIRLRIDVERRVDGGAAVELDLAFLEVEAAAGKIIGAADKIGGAGDGRAGDGAANVQIGAPFALQAKARDGQAVAGARLDREIPGNAGAGPLYPVAATVDLYDAQFRDLRHGGGAPHGEEIGRAHA